MSFNLESSAKKAKARKREAKEYYIDRARRETKKKFPPSEAQLKYIEDMKKTLLDAGHDTSYLAEPEDKIIAQHVIGSLKRLCEKYGLRGDKG